MNTTTQESTMSDNATIKCPSCYSNRTWDQSIANSGTGHLCYDCGTTFGKPQAWLELTVPPTFFHDTHASDCLVSFDGERDFIKDTKRSLIVRLTEDDAHELLDRADFYASSVADMEGYFGLCMSARATAIAIRKQWPEAAAPRF
jgi:hypothetical protein